MQKMNEALLKDHSNLKKGQSALSRFRMLDEVLDLLRKKQI
jgi:hypothetical protein